MEQTMEDWINSAKELICGSERLQNAYDCLLERCASYSSELKSSCEEMKRRYLEDTTRLEEIFEKGTGIREVAVSVLNLQDALAAHASACTHLSHWHAEGIKKAREKTEGKKVGSYPYCMDLCTKLAESMSLDCDMGRSTRVSDNESHTRTFGNLVEKTYLVVEILALKTGYRMPPPLQ